MSNSQFPLYASRIADKFVVRFPDGMRNKIADVARGNFRSMNSEILARLEASLEAESQMGMRTFLQRTAKVCPRMNFA